MFYRRPLQGRQGQILIQAASQVSTADATYKHIHDHIQAYKLGLQADVDDVYHPNLIWASHFKLLNHDGIARKIMLTIGGAALFALDVVRRRPVALTQVDETNPQAVRLFLKPFLKYLEVSVIVTDDLASFRMVAEKLGCEHQVCQFHLCQCRHVRRWVGRSLRFLS